MSRYIQYYPMRYLMESGKWIKYELLRNLGSNQTQYYTHFLTIGSLVLTGLYLVPTSSLTI